MNDLHEAAMAAVDEALIARRTGRGEDALARFREAMELEAEAAQRLLLDFDNEPSRSVLFRSAAALALSAGDLQRAEQLIGAGLMGNPPAEIADELRDLYHQAHLRRYLDEHGTRLGPGELEMVMVGNGIGAGVARADDVVERVRTSDAILVRMVERHNDLPFRENGPPKASVREAVTLFMAVPLRGSFALRFQVGESQQKLVGSSETWIREYLECFAAFERNDQGRLEQLIPQDTYRRNFTALARKLAPDGQRVSRVALRGLYRGTEQRVELARPRRGWSMGVALADGPLQVRGELLQANSLVKAPAIHIRHQDGSITKILVPEGMMNDIVRPHFGEVVEVEARQEKGALHLVNIERVEE